MSFDINNLYEELVIERVLKKLDNYKEFDHDHLEDIACLALNKLPAKYIRYQVDAAASLNLEQHDLQDVDIDNAVEYAIEIVRTRRHDKH